MFDIALDIALEVQRKLDSMASISYGAQDTPLVRLKRISRRSRGSDRNEHCEDSASVPFADYYLSKLRSAAALWQVVIGAALGAVSLTCAPSSSAGLPDGGREGKEQLACAVCKVREKLYVCSRCKSAAYCCAQHQKSHWSVHKVRFSRIPSFVSRQVSS